MVGALPARQAQGPSASAVEAAFGRPYEHRRGGQPQAANPAYLAGTALVTARNTGYVMTASLPGRPGRGDYCPKIDHWPESPELKNEAKLPATAVTTNIAHASRATSTTLPPAVRGFVIAD